MDDKLEFSTDTVLFDTVFATIGSTTEYFRVINPHNKSIAINNLALGKGESSAFRINVDGIPLTNTQNILIEPDDSVWIFVEVTVDPNDENLPFIVQDSIIFESNGNTYDIDLVAYGQNAHFFNEDTLQSQTWTNDKPYVIYKYIVIDNSQTLTIEEGTRVHLHNGASIVAKGNLIVNGTAENLVTFKGTRLEESYEFLPAQWGAIFLHRNTTNEINYADISSGVFGLAVGYDLEIPFTDFTVANATKCTVNNSIIRFNFGANILTILADLEVNNSLIYNGTRNIQGLLGGSHEFNNCTVASVYNRFFNHEDPMIFFSNLLLTEEFAVLRNLEKAEFNNSIIYGNLKEELEYFNEDTLDAIFNYAYNNCLVRTDSITDPNLVNCILNVNPEFLASDEEDYRLSEYSPCINAANNATALPTDILNNPRVGNADIGCFEFIE